MITKVWEEYGGCCIFEDFKNDVNFHNTSILYSNTGGPWKSHNFFFFFLVGAIFCIVFFKLYMSVYIYNLLTLNIFFCSQEKRLKYRIIKSSRKQWFLVTNAPWSWVHCCQECNDADSGGCNTKESPRTNEKYIRITFTVDE